MSVKHQNRGRRKRVGVMLDLDWPYKRHHEVYAGIRRYAETRGNWECVLDMYPVRRLRSDDPDLQYDGIIARATPEVTTCAKQSSVALVNTYVNSTAKDVTTISVDQPAVGIMAADHLLEHGFTRFGHLGITKDRSSQLRNESFHEHLRQHGIPAKHILNLYVTSYRASNRKDWEEFERSLEEWIDTWILPIGIFVAYDHLCRELMLACARRGIRIPEEAAMISVHNEPVVCTYAEPTISSIDLNYDLAGYKAAEELDRLMNGETDSHQLIQIPIKSLIPRQSTDAYAVRDPIVAKALRFISKNCHKGIKVGDVASGCFIARRTLERAFEAASRRSLADELTFARLQRLKRYLMESNAPMKELADKTGFGNPAHMSTVFKRWEGMSPSEYRSLSKP